MSDDDEVWVPKRPRGLKKKPAYTEEPHLNETAPTITTSKAHNGNSWVVVYIMPVVLAVLSVILVQHFFLQPFSIPSLSMAPTLQIEDRIVVLKPVKNFKRGDIVVFEPPQGWFANSVDPAGNPIETEDTFLVKRIIGLPGDTIQCCAPSGALIINTIPYAEPYTANGQSGSVEFTVTVPPNSYFVMGDNRDNSADSRSNLTVNNGSVPADDIVGKVVFRFWPFDTSGRFPDVIYE